MRNVQRLLGSTSSYWDRDLRCLYLEHDIDTCSEPAGFYLLPKVHKTPVAWRPIVSCTTYITAGLGRMLAAILNDVINQLPHRTILRDSSDLR